MMGYNPIDFGFWIGDFGLKSFQKLRGTPSEG